MSVEKLNALRARHPELRYRQYTINREESQLRLEYHYTLAPDVDFVHTLKLPGGAGEYDSQFERLVFLIGMVEMISYWKTACPLQIVVECGALSAKEINWWKGLYLKGLGEFFFLNKISPHLEFSITAEAAVDAGPATLPTPPSRESALVMIGGGKDSIVTLETLRALEVTRNMALSAFCVNPIPASLEAITIAEYPPPLIIDRKLDKKISSLNQAGYLNGHVPYSASLAFISVAVAQRNGFTQVLVSNESSASEGNAFVEGVEVNHQYSKGFEFESNFRDYLKELGITVNYFSFLRPMNELQICALFASFPRYHPVFRSCNREQTAAARERTVENLGGRREGWCGECPKCVFTWICLSCFLKEEEVTAIFGVSPTRSPGFLETVRALAGAGDHKPFECVGTYQEVQSALELVCKKLKRGSAEEIALREELLTLVPDDVISIEELLERWDRRNFLPAMVSQQLRDFLGTTREGLNDRL